MTSLPPDLVEMLRGRALCFVTTLMPDGSPVTTETWVDTDGEHVVVNTVTTHQKSRNIARDPRVAVAIADPDQPARYWGVRGRVVATTTEGGDAHIDQLSQRYLGRPYPGFGGAGSRLIVTIAADRVHSPQR
ncbi:PPOX class F420-dependent oxidoreductase [Nocardioides sp. ChNu-153]|uniref:PPOX class F420-dependent oxidoreductase n=1 Tax=unclassified Nocardioides TaxID=2615069 RepID=UPI002405C523|nr:MULTISPECIES: PPOX class F420-dependent oxidoreductase [unclassified Nocardioides]MDF9716698.1 PPOX class F420-dependent oxidoreductase [Nocardioides sp. ChNu-99]MDN7121152.1 PPOX class F420-dependent oxidoreductase [Nocardioides sp. ChNu-153]